MTNNFNAEQARKNAKDVKIDQALLLEKILSGTEEISKEGKRRAVFQFPIDALHPEHITQVEEELKHEVLMSQPILSNQVQQSILKSVSKLLFNENVHNFGRFL